MFFSLSRLWPFRVFTCSQFALFSLSPHCLWLWTIFTFGPLLKHLMQIYASNSCIQFIMGFTYWWKQVLPYQLWHYGVYHWSNFFQCISHTFTCKFYNCVNGLAIFVLYSVLIFQDLSERTFGFRITTVLQSPHNTQVAPLTIWKKLKPHCEMNMWSFFPGIITRKHKWGLISPSRIANNTCQYNSLGAFQCIVLKMDMFHSLAVDRSGKQIWVPSVHCIDIHIYCKHLL